MSETASAARPGGLSIGGSLRGARTLGPLAGLVVLCIVFGIAAPVFIIPRNLIQIVQQVMEVGTLAVGQTIVILTAGIDLSNADEGTAVLLPKDPDRSARRFRSELRRRRNVDVAVIITDTFGRVWRNGVTDIALGSAGILPILDLRGTRDANGRQLEATEVAIADEIAGAANLVLGKAKGTPFAIVRGLDPSYFGDGSISEHMVRSPFDDLFR